MQTPEPDLPVIPLADNPIFATESLGGWKLVGRLAGPIEFTPRCPSVAAYPIVAGARCQLGEGHDGWHRCTATTEAGYSSTTTWQDASDPVSWDRES